MINLWYRWAMDEINSPWVIHSCSDGIKAFRISKKECDNAFLNCTKCHYQQKITESNKTLMSEVDKALKDIYK